MSLKSLALTTILSSAVATPAVAAQNSATQAYGLALEMATARGYGYGLAEALRYFPDTDGRKNTDFHQCAAEALSGFASDYEFRESDVSTFRRTALGNFFVVKSMLSEPDTTCEAFTSILTKD